MNIDFIILLLIIINFILLIINYSPFIINYTNEQFKIY